MDPKVVAKLHDAFKKAIEDRGWSQILERYEMVPNYKNTRRLSAAVAEQVKTEEALLKRIGHVQEEIGDRVALSSRPRAQSPAPMFDARPYAAMRMPREPGYIVQDMHDTASSSFIRQATGPRCAR